MSTARAEIEGLSRADKLPVAPGESPPLAIVYFGNDWFAENRTSSHQIARVLAKRFAVHYVECPGLRAPKGSGRDLLKIWKKVRRYWQGGKPTPEGITIFTLLQVPLHRFRLVRWINRVLIRWTLRRLIRRARLDRPVLWFMIPHLGSVIGELGERLAVYYCIDDYAALPDVNPQAVAAMDEETTRKADLVFVASDTLLEAKKRLNARTYCSPHGVDFDHFARAQDASLRVPEDAKDLPRPIIGFFGLIERWIELDLIRFLAEQRPHWTFLMIGRVAVEEEAVPRLPNIHYLGKRGYESLPAYGKAFDVAIIPYHLTQQVIHANPIKLREYLAMGKPIVSVSTPEIDKYEDVVEIAHSHEEFLACLDKVVSAPATSAETRRRMARVDRESWHGRIDEAWNRVQKMLDEQATSAPVLAELPASVR